MPRHKRFEDINVYELGGLKGSSAFSLPGIGIFVGPAHSSDYHLLRHEYGHILQYNKQGPLNFYLIIAPVSLLSACYERLNKNYRHKNAGVEIRANALSYTYFGQPENWDTFNFPLEKYHG